MRGDTIKRTYLIIKMIEAGPVTCRMIADRFGFHRHCAQRYIDQLSCFLPIVETGLDRSGGGRPGIVYELKEEA